MFAQAPKDMERIMESPRPRTWIEVNSVWMAGLAVVLGLGCGPKASEVDGLGSSISSKDASKPHACVTVYRGPIPDRCDLKGEWSGTGTGKDLAQAQRFASDRLLLAVSAGVEAMIESTAGTMAATRVKEQEASCVQVAREVAIPVCIIQEEWTEPQYCFVSFKSPDCWSGYGIEVDGLPVWKGMEKGRQQICAQMEKELSDAEPEFRASCMARCYQETRAKCNAL